MARPRGLATKQIRSIRKSLLAIERALLQLAPILRAKAAGRPVARSRRKVTITPQRRAALKLQGRYMGYMRQLPPRKKALVKAVKEKKGIAAAIAAAKRLGHRAA
jgi:hypothetical protein